MGLPRLDEHAVLRPRLLERLDDLPALTLVSGPRGSGKTTLVAQWAAAEREAGGSVLWLDGAVDSPHAAVQSMAAFVEFDLPSDLPPAEALAALTPSLRTLADRLVIVIDGFDPVADQIGAPLMELLGRCRQLHLVVCVRGRHDFIWQAVVGAGYQVITVDDLAFTPDELRTYAASRGASLADPQIDSILEQTSGATGLIRVGLQRRSGIDADDGQAQWSWENVREYLRENILRTLPIGDLAGVSALAHLAGTDIDIVRTALTPHYDTVFAAVQRVGAVERDRRSDRLYLRMPPIVADVLRSMHDPAHDLELAALYDVVIAGLERMGQVLAAVDLARRTARHELLLDLVKRHWWDIAAEDIAALAVALETIPEEMLAPRTVLIRHLSELIPDRVTDEPLADIESLPRGAAELREVAEGPDARTHLDGVMIGLMAARFRGERGKVHQEIARGMAMAKIMTRDTEHEVPVGVRRFFVQAGLAHLLEMDLPAAELAFRRGYGPDDVEKPDVLRREAANKLAFVHALKGDHVATRAWLDRSTAISPPTGWLAPMIEAPRRLAEALIALDRLDQTEVERLLAELSATVATDELWFMELAVRAAAALLWGGSHVVLHEIQQQRAERAHLVADGTLAHAQLVAWEISLQVALGRGTEADLLATEHPHASRVKIIRARLLLLSGRGQGALAVLASVTQTPHALTRLRVEALLLTAQALAEQDQSGAAATYLGEAARHREFLSPFAVTPRALLADHVEAVPALGPILRDLDEIGVAPPFPESLTVISLTERELQLIELLPTTRSRDSIAKALFVSTNTVKTQLQGLYRKLGVSSREEAVARAYELGLLT